MNIFILFCFCISVVNILSTNGEKLHIREKRALRTNNGTETEEYKFFEKSLHALDNLDGGSRRDEFRKRTTGKQIEHWGPIFGDKEMSYTKAVEHITTQLHNNKLRIPNLNEIIDHVRNVCKYREKSLKKGSGFEGHNHANKIWKKAYDHIVKEPFVESPSESRGNVHPTSRGSRRSSKSKVSKKGQVHYPGKK